MTRNIFITIVTALTVFCNTLPAEAAISDYTEAEPLVIISDWEFPPYEFINDKGEPDGYNVEILNLILNHLKIPHKFVMQEWYQATKTFEERKGDLIHALSYNYRKRPYFMTKNMITYYRVTSVRLRGTKPLKKISQLGPKDSVILKNNDYVALRVIETDPKFKVFYHSPKEALTRIRNGKYKYYLWGEMPIKMKIKEFGLDSLVLDVTDIPPGELRIIGYDKELIEAIDDTFTRLEQDGQVEKIYDKWFHPEHTHADTSPLALIILVGTVIAIVIALLLSRLIKVRVQASINQANDLNNIMTQTLNMGNFYVLNYNTDSKLIQNAYGSLIPEKGMTLKDFYAHIHPEDREDFISQTEDLVKGVTNQTAFTKRYNKGTEESPDWCYLQGNSIVEKEHKKMHHIVFSLKDITIEAEEEQINNEMSAKYIKIFETNIVAMSFFDKDGKLLDVNEKMKKLCEFDAEGEKFFRQSSLFDNPIMKGDYDFHSGEVFYSCQRMFYPEIGIKKHIELRIRPVIDGNNVLHYYIITARDISEDRLSYLTQIKHEKEIHAVNESIIFYEQQLRYLLENSNMFIWHSDLRNNKIYYSHSLNKIEYEESLEDYVERMYPEEQVESTSAMNNPIFMNKPFNVIHHFKYTHYFKKPVWMAISAIPTYEKNGERIGYFGVSRDVTYMMEAQEKLKEETERADSSGKMKSAFLANMTHEIRTPLNAIVGFSDLLPLIDTAEERMMFIRIIRNNCDMLTRLINDILEASSMGQSLSIKPEEVDLAKVFDEICQTLAQRVDMPGVEFIKDNPYESFPATIDKGRIQQILTNFTTNAVKYTHEGHIKLGYHEQDGGIYFYCEDTGAGIPQEQQAAVFDRFVKLNDFVQGTGLGLSICKAIAERCGGKIGVKSDGAGHGSTFWLWTPKIIIPPKND